MNTQYLNEIKQYKLLSKEEEFQLFEQYNNGDDKAFQALVNHNLYNVYIIIDKLGYRFTSMQEEMVAVGNETLIKAIKKYDHNKQTARFVTYLKTCISNDVAKHRVKCNNTIRVTYYTLAIYRKIESYPTLEIAQKEMGLADWQMKNYHLYNQMDKTESLDEPYTNNNGDEVFLEPSELSDEPLDGIEGLIKLLPDALRILNERQQYIIKHYFGIGTPKTKLRVIGEALSLDKAQVSGHKQRALKKLKEYMVLFHFNNKKIIL